MSTHLNPLDILLESQQPDRPPPDFRWGVVNGTSPDLSVRLDRDPTTVIGSCCSLTYPIQAGDRVMVMIYDGRAVVFGRGGGDRPDPWQSWTPSFVSDGTNPTMGNSARVGRYISKRDGTVTFTGKITIGSSFAAGTGVYSLPLPVPANVSSGIEWHVGLHVASTSVVGGGGDGVGFGKIESSTLIDRMYVRRNDASATNMERLDANSGWTEGDRLVVSGTYERAV